MKSFTIKTSKKYEMIDITEKVNSLIDIDEGMCLVFAKHATSAIVINENYDPNICDDVLNALDKLIPEGVWKHDRIDGNAAAHIKASILGPSEMLIVKRGKLLLGRWQSLMLVELDGPREREVLVEIK
jgi:secondary thiamine-phosphate synthase enzyme